MGEKAIADAIHDRSVAMGLYSSASTMTDVMPADFGTEFERHVHKTNRAIQEGIENQSDDWLWGHVNSSHALRDKLASFKFLLMPQGNSQISYATKEAQERIGAADLFVRREIARRNGIVNNQNHEVIDIT